MHRVENAALVWNIFPTISLPLSVTNIAPLRDGDIDLRGAFQPQTGLSAFQYTNTTELSSKRIHLYCIYAIQRTFLIDLCWFMLEKVALAHIASLASVLQLKMWTTGLTLNLGKSITGSLKPAGSWIRVHIWICFWPLREEQDHKRGTLVVNDKWFGQRRRPWPLL